MIETLYMVELIVADWSRSLRWYCDVLGLQPALSVEADRFALFETEGLRLALKEGEARPGSVRLTFEVDDLAAQLARLAALGVVLEGEVKVSREGYRRALFRDPDGHGLSLFEWMSPRGL
jgi:catechol 2,3-dioxygenase-like lactoylglutathione lyase family enzyme